MTDDELAAAIQELRQERYAGGRDAENSGQQQTAMLSPAEAVRAAIVQEHTA
jgi:hypothetical protein